MWYVSRGDCVDAERANGEGVDGRVRGVRHYAVGGGSSSRARAKCDEGDAMMRTGEQRKLGEVSGSQDDVERLS